jgi:hypothetical protein
MNELTRAVLEITHMARRVDAQVPELTLTFPTTMDKMRFLTSFRRDVDNMSSIVLNHGDPEAFTLHGVKVKLTTAERW